MRLFSIILLGAALLAVPVSALEVTGLEPVDCAAIGDKIVIVGTDFPALPVVKIDGVAATVIKSKSTKIMVRIPAGVATGTLLDVDVDGEILADSLTALPADSPVVKTLSSATATPGQEMLLVGKRLTGATVDIVDDLGFVAASVALTGADKVATFTLPATLAVGDYTLEVVSADGLLDTGDCSPELEVVAAGAGPEVDSITPAKALPDEDIDLLGTDLGPGGADVDVCWTAADGTVLVEDGKASGFDRVRSEVPEKATPGATYDVTVKFPGGATTEAVSYEVGTPPPPVIDSITPMSGPAGTKFDILGQNLATGKPVVELTAGTTVVTAEIKSTHDGDLQDKLSVKVPTTTADDDYIVSVTVGTQSTTPPMGTVGFVEDETEFDGDDALSDVDDFYNGMWVHFLTGSVNDGELRKITDYVGADRTFVVDPGFTLEPDIDDEFEIVHVFSVAPLPLTVTSMSPTSQPSTGPKDPVVIKGTGFGVAGSPLDVEWDDGTTVSKGTIQKHSDGKLVVVPPGGTTTPLAPGDYDVYVVRDPGTADEESVKAGEYKVDEPVTGGGGGGGGGLDKLTATTMTPSTQAISGPTGPITITGTGFGEPGSRPKLAVVFDDGVTELNAIGKKRSPTKIEIFTPGGKTTPLAEGTYDVYVVRDPGGVDEEKVLAGEFTVE